MKNCVFSSLALIATASIVLLSCNKTDNDISVFNSSLHNSVISGTTDFLSTLNSLCPTFTKTGEVTVDEAKDMIQPLLSESINYLENNGYDCLEDFDSLDDPRITWVALGLAELDLTILDPKTTVGGCVLTAFGLDASMKKALKDKAVKAVIRKFASKALSKAIPYVGEVLIAYDFVNCMSGDMSVFEESGKLNNVSDNMK